MMASGRKQTSDVSGEILIAWQSYTACSSDEINLKEGDVVELIDPNDSATPIKRQKFSEDADLDAVSGELLDNSAAKHKLSVKPKRKHSSNRTSPSRLSLNKRWLVREINGKKQGWVPCRILQAADDPTPGGSMLPGDAIYRRQAVVNELVETEQEFVRDLEFVVQKYLILSEKGKVPKVVRDNLEVIFGNLKEIAEFHKTVLMEGVKYYANEPHLLGKAFLRLERDFDKHVDYCVFEPQAQAFLDHCDAARDYFDELSQRLGDDKSIAEHLKLPIQRINDYQLLLKLNRVILKDHTNEDRVFELIDNKEGHSLILTSHRDNTKDYWLEEISEFAKNYDEQEEADTEDFEIASPVESTSTSNKQLESDTTVPTSRLEDRASKKELQKQTEAEKQIEAQEQLIKVLLTPSKSVESKTKEAQKVEESKATQQKSTVAESTKPTETVKVQPPKPLEIPQPVASLKPVEAPKTAVTLQPAATPKPVEAPKSTETLKSAATPKPAPETSKAAENPKPVEAAKPTETPKSAATSKPAETSKSAENIKPVETAKPTETLESAATPKAAATSKLTEKPKPVEAAKPEETPKPTASSKPVEASKTAVTPQPAATPKPVETPKHTETIKSAGTPKPAEAPTPAANPKPVEASKPTETPKPAEVPKTAATPKLAEAPNPTPKRVEASKPTETPKTSKPAETEKVKTKPSETPKLADTIKSNSVEELQPNTTTPKAKDNPGESKPKAEVEVKKEEEFKPHLAPIQAVETLVQLNKKRELETPIPHVLEPYVEPHGSALNKLYSVEPVSAGNPQVITDYSIGIEVNVEVDDMSKRYSSSSSARADSHLGSSSYSKRSYQSSYSSDLPSSRYESDSIASKYSTESSLGSGSKYESLSSKYSKYDTADNALTSSYSSRRSEDNDYGSSRRSLRLARGSEDNDYSSTRKSLALVRDEDDYYSSPLKDRSSEAYSRRSIRSTTTIDAGDGENNYSKKYSMKAAAEEIDDGSSRYVRRSIKTNLDGDEREESDSYSTRSRRALQDDRSSGKRSVSIEQDSSSKYLKKYTDEEEDLYAKYSPTPRKQQGGEEEDVYAKFERKYSRTDSSDNKSKYSRTDSSDNKSKYSRTTSAEKSTGEEDVYAKYSRKYSRTDSAEKKAEESGHKYSRTESVEKRYGEEEDKKSSRTDSRKSYADEEDTGYSSKKYSRSESKEAKKSRKSRVEKDDQESTSVQSTTKTTTIVDSKGTTQTAIESSAAYSSTTEVMKETTGKSAVTKLAELESEDDSHPRFIKTIRGANIEPGENIHFEVALNEKPTNFSWLKDNVTLKEDGRIQMSYCNKTQEYKLLIQQVREEDAGTYMALANSPTWKASCHAPLIVHKLSTDELMERTENDKPEFLVNLKDTELPIDTYLRFMIKIRGDPNPDITFFKDGVKISENAERLQIIREHSDKGFYELLIPEVKMGDAGLYKCVATNRFGESSSEATLTVIDNTKIHEEMPEGEILPPGEKPEFTWKKDGVFFEPEERFKVLMGDDEDSLALVFQHVRPEDVGLYTCVAQTSRGHISCSAELTVHGTVNQLFREPEKPQLIIEKKDPIVTQGGSAMLELQVKGYPKPTVKWQHEGKTIEASSKYKILYEDEESMSLVIKNVESSDAGKYTIIAENELGSETAEMSLTVKAPPKVKAKIEDVDVHADLLLKIPVEIEGIPKPTVMFYKDGKEIKQDQRIKVVEEGEKHILVIEKTQLKDSGTYSVVATNELAQVSQFWKTDIHSKPKIIEKLGQDRQISQGQNLELKVKIEAEPRAEVKWFKDESEITSSDHFVLKEDGDSYILRITGAVTTDAAKYKFKAVNIHGSVEDDVRVDVKKGPKITKPLQNMTVTEHDTDVTFDVRIEAFPKPTIKWYLDEMEITETKTEFTRIESDDGAKLVIKEVNSQLSGKYTCKLSNECGEAETSAKLTVNCAPRIIKHLQDTTVEEGATLHLEVEVEGCPSPTVKWLRNGREVSADARIKISRDTQRNETYNLAVNLIKYEEQGEYEVVVTNSLGTVSSKSYVTVHKITHTDAIEETGEPPQKFEIIQDDNESQNANLAEKQEIEEVPKKEPSKPKVKEIEEPKSAQGSLAEKVDIEKKPIRSPEPIVEEPVSPQIKPKRGRSAILEDLEISEIEEDESQRYEEQQMDQRGILRRGISATIEEVEETKHDIKRQTSAVEDKKADEPKRAVLTEKEKAEIVEAETKSQQYEESEIEKKVLKRGISATVEVVAEANSEIKRQTSTVEDTKIESKKGVLADKEEAELIESKVESKKVSEIDLPNKTAKSAKSFSQDEIIENVLEHSRPKTVEQREREEAEVQKGVRYHDEEADDEMEKLLSRAQKARQLSDESSKRDVELSEAVPVILDTNMKDGSRPESLDITYIVRGTANPPPTASWTLNDSEIKPNKNLRMTVSENGEEFKLEIKKLAMADAGTYKCTLTNPLGAVKQQAVLEVTPEKELRRPKLKKSLEDQTIVKKNQVIFKVVCIGDPVPEGTWYFNDKEISDSDFEKHKIILETEDHEIEDGLKECSYVLTIPRCERCNGGKYTFKGKNKWSECSTSAVLTIVLRPEITGPENISVVPGEPAEFSAVIQSNPNPEVTWTKDGEVVKSGGDIEIVEDVANETYKLIFKKTKLSDEGYYKVTAKNNLGEDVSEARFKAIKEAEPSTEKPRFITGLTDEQVEHTGETSIMIRADGLPKPDIKWFLNDKPITEDEYHKIETHKETQVTSTFSVSNYGESDVGILKAIAVNVVGEAETTSRITMLQTPPTFGKRLEKSQEVNEFEPLELKAKINGSPKPTVAWFKDGEPIPEDDPRIKTTLLPDGTVKLNIDKVSANDSGAYKLVVKNPNGETACLCAVAVTQKPQRPKFVKCFKDMSIPTGESLRLEAVIQAYPPPEIKWLKDGLPVRQSANLHVEHHPDGTVALVVDCAKPENAGRYELIATNKLGEAVEDAEVDVEKKPTKPQFIIRLEPQTVVEGFPVKLEVKAEGYPAPTITWKRNGAEVISDKKHVKMMDMPDGTSVLILDAADIARDAITYRAIATNEAGEAETSAPLKISPSTKDDEPEDRPIFLHALKDVITDEGQPLILSAPFTGNPIPSVSWTKDGVPLEQSDRILTTCDGKKLGLRIDNALPSDAGQYGVAIVNPLGKDSSEAKATVHKVFMPPSFTQRFTDLQQLPTRDAKFPCKVSGVPQPEVTWSKDGVPIKETDKYHIKRDGDNCCLYVMNCSPADAGVYRATATNKEGQEVCTGALEVVDNIKIAQKVEPAAFLKRIGDTELFKGMTAKFTACMSGHPEPDVEWFHNDQKIFPSNRIKMETDRAGLLRLTIAGVDQDDLGKYTCKISNPHGSDICHANLNIDTGVEPKPKRPITDQYTEYDKYKRSGAPMPLSDPPIISQMTDRHCTLSWKPSIPSGPRVPVTYQLEMCELPSGDWFTVRSGIRSCTCGVRNLEPFRDYKFRVRVENKYGISDPSPYAITHREKLEPDLPKFRPYLPPEIDFRPETSPYFPKDFDIERPPHDNMAQAPKFLRQEHDTQYGVKDQSTNLFWFVYGYPKPKMTYYFNDELIEGGGRFDMSYTRNGQATLFINKMLDRDVGWYEAVARNEHGEARQRVRLEIAELPMFIRRPEIEYAMLRDRAKFEARIVGVPYPEIKWYKDWKPLAASSRTKIQFIEPDTHILIINDVICKDEGLYSVSARNVAGSASSSAMLYVEENDLEYNIRTYSNCSPIKTKRRLYTDLYDIGDELGRGTQGITYHAVERMNGRNYAAKIMHGHGEMRPHMYNELEMMNQLRHRKLISLHDAFEMDESLTLILELASGGEMVKDYLLKQDYYTESDIAGFIRQTLQGLQYMHERGFGHMGLDLGDLLISHPGGDDLKITDFGLTRRIQMGRLYPLNFGMPEYVSPECANGEGVGLGHDMWSIGIITYILLSGRSPFRGINDMETLTRIREGKWTFIDEEWWLHISSEARDFISKLLVYQSEGRLDVHAALRHPWLERADKLRTDEYRISSKYLSDYWRLYREWYDNANCRRWYRRRPLEGAFTHPSRMVYPPGEDYSPRPTPAPQKPPRIPTWEEQLPTRSPLNYEIGMIKSESHYQNGPDTYLLQLRDVDFPVRLREYMKVAGSRGPGASYIVSDENGYDWRTPTIRERRRFTDIMDEEIDDERKARINRYGASDSSYSIRRLKHELGSRLDTYVEAEAFLESKQDGRLPFFREKPQMSAMIEGQDLKLSCFAVGEPKPIVQWFKNDQIIAESHRIKILMDEEGRSFLKLCPALSFDQGMYKVVARNKIGQTIARARIVLGLVPDEPDSPEASDASDTEIFLTWKQPKFDGNSPVLCYRLEYKLADDMEWTKKADNIDHEFYLMTGLTPNSSYIFRLAARNAIGWSDQGVPSPVIKTKDEGAPKVQVSQAIQHLQQITDSGLEVGAEDATNLDYKVESQPVEWENVNVQEQYNLISEISRGRFSTVLKAIDKGTDALVVAKILDLSPEHVHDVDGEFAALRSLRHERVAGLLAAYRSNESPVAVFIMEKLQGADILTYLASRHEYSEQMVATIITQVLDGLQYLHWRGLCHLDLQPDNVVMSAVRSIQIKLVDLGSAHRVTKLGTKVPVVGHPDYISPEVLSEEPAFPQTDIWSVGVLTYVMLSGVVPFRGKDENENRQNILFVRYQFEHLYSEISQEGTRFLMLLFKRQPNKRPTAEECHENRWLMPTDHMIKKRERAVFLGNRLKEYSSEYHNEKAQLAQDITQKMGGKFNRSHSIQEELLTAP